MHTCCLSIIGSDECISLLLKAQAAPGADSTIETEKFHAEDEGWLGFFFCQTMPCQSRDISFLSTVNFQCEGLLHKVNS